jgi:hypothetical protein
MNLHIVRSETRSFFGARRYCLSARVTVTPDQMTVITHHGLERTEIFFDPERDRLEQAADDYHQQARARGLFVTKARDAAAVSFAETRAIIASIRALNAFNITLADLLRGVTIENASLHAIRDFERILTASVDTINETLQAAAGFSDTTEDVFEPGDEHEPTTPPAQWARTWRR